MGRFNEGLAAVRSGDKWGYIDVAGQFVIPRRFTFASEFSEGLAHARWHDESGTDVFAYVDRVGETVFVCEQGDPDVRMTPSQCRRPFVGGFVNRSGEFVIPPQFESAEPFAEGLAAVCCPGQRTRYIDRNGRPAFDAVFPRGPLRAGRFVGGVALVEIDGLGQGYIDRSGRLIAPVRDRN